MAKRNWIGNVITGILLVILILGLLGTVGCGEKGREKNTIFDAESYRDFTEVVLNTEKYPKLERLGLKLVTGYGESYAWAQEGNASDAEVIRNSFDPNKNILVIINGLQVNYGRRGIANMQSNSRVKEIEKYGREGDAQYFLDDPNSLQVYDLAKYWKDNGYNVFYFHWENFSDHNTGMGGLDAVSTPNAVQERIWTTDTGVRAAYEGDGVKYETEPNTAVNGSLAEWFVGEYIRMANAVKEVYPDYIGKSKDIRIAGHSMGGILTNAGTTLLKLAAEDGQVDMAMTPNRLAMMDSYIGINGEDYTISWSGKKYVGGVEGVYLSALELLIEEFGVAVEFYTNEGFTVPFLAIQDVTDLQFDNETKQFTGATEGRANKILSLCPIIELSPYFVGVTGPIFGNGHNPVREWYLTSLLYDAPKTADGTTVPTARMSDEDVKALRGKFFVMENAKELDCETVRCNDDTFVLMN